MILLDSYAVLALLKGERAAPLVGELIQDPAGAALTALGVAEVLDHLVRRVGAAEEEAASDLARLPLQPAINLDTKVAIRAAFLRARHYHRSVRAVSLADCVAAEIARNFEAPLATADPHLLAMCAAEGIQVLRLPGGG